MTLRERGSLKPSANWLTCEAVIAIGWYTFVDVGVALGQIRDQQLYRGEYESFQTYCREKWQYGRDYVDRLISAAQVFKRLLTNCQHRKPEYESQVRPLVGLTAEQAQAAWEYAVQRGGKGKITARMVKTAMRDLQLAGNSQPVTRISAATKRGKRRAIDDTIGQLLTLLSQKASYETLTEKVECLHGHIQAMFTSAPRRK